MRKLSKAGAIASLLNAIISIANIIVVFGVLGAEVVADPTLVVERVRVQPLPLTLLEVFKIVSAFATLFVILAIHQRQIHAATRVIQLATWAGVVSVLLLLSAGTFGSAS